MPLESPFTELREHAGWTQTDLALRLDLSREYLIQHELGLVNSPQRELILYLNQNSPTGIIDRNFRRYPNAAYANFLTDYYAYRQNLRENARPHLPKPRYPQTFRSWRAAHCRSSRQFAKLVGVGPNDVVLFEQKGVLTPYLEEALNDLGLSAGDFRRE